MHLHEYAHCDAIGLRELMRAREVTAAEVEAVARKALAAADAELNGLAFPLFSPALDRADDGLRAGVPFLIKDSGPMAKGVPFGQVWGTTNVGVGLARTGVATFLSLFPVGPALVEAPLSRRRERGWAVVPPVAIWWRYLRLSAIFPSHP